jgi:hypothetical protein
MFSPMFRLSQDQVFDLWVEAEGDVHLASIAPQMNPVIVSGVRHRNLGYHQHSSTERPLEDYSFSLNYYYLILSLSSLFFF